MKKRTRSILEELDSIGQFYDRKQIVENTATNLIASATNLLSLIKETYDTETAIDLEKRLFSSIRTGDEKKFIRGIRKVNENKQSPKGDTSLEE